MSLGKWLKKLRIDYDLTLKDFGDKIGIKSISYLSGIERGTQKPSKDFEKQIISNFDIDNEQQKLLHDLISSQIEQAKEYRSLSSSEIILARRLTQIDTSNTEFQKDLDKILNKYLKRGN